MYTLTVGLEVHAELKTKSKMFCGCANDPHGSDVNINICPICLAHPGTLPVPNQAAIKSVLLFGTAVGGELATYSEFDRKNYFYPDIPKAYQLSQYAFPFVKGGTLAGVELTRVHLEEDTARSQHDKGAGSLVDYNRAGVPLMELVTEPVIHTAEEAGAFARELQLVLRTLGISDANMEKGEMRVEANISVSSDGQRAKKYVEVKNLNSFKSVESAIKYEMKRQIDLIEAGGAVQQETRGWDDDKSQTYLQRTKETAKDYRYFPDPDIPKYEISAIAEFSKEYLSETMPTLPEEKRLKYSNLGLPNKQIEVMIQDQELDRYFEEVCAAATDQSLLPLAANYLVTDITPLWQQNGDKLVVSERLSPLHFLELISLVIAKKVSSRVAKDLLIEFALSDTNLLGVIDQRGLLSENSVETIEQLVKDIILDNESVAAEYRAGKTASLQFLLGQAMKQTRGAADPIILRETFERLLAI